MSSKIAYAKFFRDMAVKFQELGEPLKKERRQVGPNEQQIFCNGEVFKPGDWYEVTLQRTGKKQSRLETECGRAIIEAHRFGLFADCRSLCDAVAEYHAYKEPSLSKKVRAVWRKVPSNLFTTVCGGHMVLVKNGETDSQGRFIPIADEDGYERCGGVFPAIAPIALVMDDLERRTACCEWLAGLVEDCTPKLDVQMPSAKDFAALPIKGSNEELVYRVMGNAYPRLLTVEQILASKIDNEPIYIDEKTVRTIVNLLIKQGLAVRPSGKRKGVKLTPKGKAIADEISK